MKHTARYKTWEAFRIFVLAVISLIVVFPFFWMIICSFKSSSEVLSKNSFWPSVWHVENYALAWGRARFDIYFRNSTLMALASVAGQLITSSMAAYAFAKLKFKLSKPLFMVFLCSMMIPLEATIVSNYLTLSAMGLMDTFFAVISTSIVSVFGVFLLRQFYMTIPDALLEAARIDGASEVQSFVRIILPLGKSAMATIAIIGFIGSWNSYLWPLIITNSMELRTVQTGLRAMMTLDVGVEWQQLMAMSTLITVPTIILFVALQKYFVQGITKVGIK
ncbi:MAG TPA: carbohydrate ABC transporter permease [Candidatus Limiplasma pullistercoris]|jgi:multiple sugar transport system permease protein|nr:carbohydrate ABC transporter permease [Clostridiales bacterium]MDY2657088.1 carbohydrate ABC transporter permease [Candidatus Limiplasma sp.]HIU08003.1 carbohydrate ABC transporter permease [Candidatus Limiplasma pullistercoris]